MITFQNLGSLGRLGNQLFQIAAVIGYAEKHKQEWAFSDWEYSKHFKIPINPNIFEIKTVIEDPDSLSYVNIPEYHNNMGNVNLHGYFQSEKYFIDSKNIILDAFRTEETNIDAGFIHIRRGDYLNNPDFHTNITLDYYKNNMDEQGFEKYLCFSDDILWAIDNLHDDRRVEFIKDTTEIEDLRLMQRCKGAIIANSSFSWWGAYLSKSKNVIIPKNWYGPAAGSFNIEDKLCDGWIAI